MGLRGFFKGISDLVGEVEDARNDGETDPLRLLERLTGRSSSSSAEPDPWWEHFGLELAPIDRAELDAAWRSWTTRNHPDRGGAPAAFRRMRKLYEHHRAKMKE